MVEDRAAAEQLTLHGIQRLRVHGQGRLAIVNAVEILHRFGNGVVPCLGCGNAHSLTQLFGGWNQLLLAPVGIGVVVVPQGQTPRQVDILGPGHPLLNHGKELIIVHSQDAAFLAQVVALVRNHRRIDLAAAGFQIPVPDLAELIQRERHRLLVKGILYLGGVAVVEENAIIVVLVQNIEGNEGFQLPESIPQGELVQGIAFKAGHEFALQNSLAGKHRELLKFPPLGQGQLVRRLHPGKHSQAKPEDHQDKSADGADLLVVHHATSLRNGNTGTD